MAASSTMIWMMAEELSCLPALAVAAGRPVATPAWTRELLGIPATG
jgi:hypothetical protein